MLGLGGMACGSRYASHAMSTPTARQADQTEETWRPVVGFESCYVVSDLGNVAAVKFRNKQVRREAWRLLKPSLTTGGYVRVMLRDCERAQNVKVHKIVLEAFVGLRPQGKRGCGHINGDPTDNRIVNLRWVTQTENEEHKREHGRVGGAKKHRLYGSSEPACQSGHPLTGGNLYYREGRRGCLTCRRILSGQPLEGVGHGL